MMKTREKFTKQKLNMSKMKSVTERPFQNEHVYLWGSDVKRFVYNAISTVRKFFKVYKFSAV